MYLLLKLNILIVKYLSNISGDTRAGNANFFFFNSQPILLIFFILKKYRKNVYVTQ